MSLPDLIYVVRGGPITDDCLGKVEWQFSDGPPGDRSYSEDYADLMEGLEAHSGKRFDFTYARPIPCLHTVAQQLADELNEWGSDTLKTMNLHVLLHQLNEALDAPHHP